MPPEEELNNPDGCAAMHPEAAASPEAALPAAELSKRQIVERIEAEAKAGKQRADGSWEASKISADERTRLKVYLFAAPEEDGHVASVVATTDYNEKATLLLREEGIVLSATASLQFAQDDPDARTALSEFFAAREDELVDPAEVVNRLSESGVQIWERPAWAEGEFAQFYSALGDEGGSGIVREVLFDEWFFLTHESWVVSRIKAGFQTIARAGEAGIELLNPIVRKTLKKNAGEIIQTADRLRALGKWIAVGGPPVAGILNPIVGLGVGTVAGGFLLLDPPDEGDPPRAPGD